jgi:hypothetical protein
MIMKDFHFFAANAFEWLVTQPDRRELPDLVAHMEKQGHPWALWQVPGEWDALYAIEWYRPKVKGAVYLGSFKPKKVREAKRKEINKNITQAVWGTV